MSRAIPLAYFVTWTCYGAHVRGDESGSVDRLHTLYGTPLLEPDAERAARDRARLRQPPYLLDERRRQAVLEAIQEVCRFRRWSLLAGHVRSTHVHVVAHALASPERVLVDFKAYSSRALARSGFDDRGRVRWSRHGSTRYLWDAEHVEAAIDYVVRRQGEPMAVFENVERALAAP